eukprot:1147497-Pelagomonas_calceolata.AAC.6
MLSRPRVFTVLNFNRVHMPLAYMKLVGLSHAVGSCGSNQYSIRTTGCESRSPRKISWKEPIITPYVHVNQACPQRALAKSFDDHSSSNIVAFDLLEMIWFWQPESMWSVLSN